MISFIKVTLYKPHRQRIIIMPNNTEAQPENNNTTSSSRTTRSSSQDGSSSSSSSSSTDDVDSSLESIREMGVLPTESMNFGIPTKQQAKKHMENTHGSDSWRIQVLRVLHSTKVEGILMGLLVLDVLVIFVEIFLLATYPPCRVIQRDAINCVPAIFLDDDDNNNNSNNTDNNNNQFRHLAAASADNDTSYNTICQEPGWEPAYDTETGCDSHKWERVHYAEEFLFGITVFILSVFFLEVLVTMIALTPRVFFRQFFYLMDFVVVPVSLGLELTFHYLNDLSLQSVVGLLVVTRIWRFVRIGHGIVEVTHKLAEREHHRLLVYTEELESYMRQNGLDIPNPEKLYEFKRSLDDSVLLKEIQEEKKRKRQERAERRREKSESSSV